jgi:lambda family phage portal protein
MKPRIRMTMKGGQLVPVQAKYEGGSHKPRIAGKGTTVSGPNTALAYDLQTLQSRSYNAVRNNSYALKAKETYVSNMVGTGIIPQWQNKEIQDLWDSWVKECDADGVQDFYGLTALAIGAQYEAGEVFNRFRYRRLTDDISVPLQLQLIESAHLDPTYSTFGEGGSLIKMGIEFNRLGNRNAYHMWRYHPHEMLTMTINERVPVPAENIIHLYRRTRPGQIRGVPELASVIVRLYEIDEMQDALLARQKLAQLFGAFVKRKTDHDPESEGPFFGTQVSMAGEVEPLTEFAPGAIHYLEDDEEITFSNPPDIGSSYTNWLKTELVAFANGAGITYEHLGDLSGVNYSSIRAGVIEFRRKIEALQAHMVIHMWCRPVAAKWLDVAVSAGRINIPSYAARRDQILAIDWIAPKWQWVDPLKEVTSLLLQVRAGFKPRSEAAAELGWSLEQLDAEIARSNQSADQNGLVLDSDPRSTQKSGALQAALEKLTEED